jgi:hypothetical protein
MFALHPDPKPASQDANQGRYLTAARSTSAGAPPPDPDVAATARILRILARLNEQAIGAGRGPLSPEVVDVALRRTTDAPDALIGRIVEGLRAGTVVVRPTGPSWQADGLLGWRSRHQLAVNGARGGSARSTG